jgi:hypothetical protein
VVHAGYTAYPGKPHLVRKPLQPQPATPTRVGRRAEAALAVYGLLRVDWPLGSILHQAAAEDRHQASQATLRDFLADVGAAIAGLETPVHLLDLVVADQAKAWWYAAREHQARRLGEGKRAELLAEQKLFHRSRARRLRKRKAYGQATAELDGALAGRLEKHEGVADAFERQLTDQGLGADDVATLVARARRITIPRL